MVRFLLHQVVPPVVMLVLLLLIWDGYIVWREVPLMLAPRPMQVAEALREDHVVLLKSAWVTARAALLGFAGAMVGGIVCAVVLASSKWVMRAAYPFTVVLQTVPIVVIAPLLVVQLGYGLRPIVASAFLASIFPVIVNTLTGLTSTEPALRDMFRLYRAGWLATLFKLRLPSALPNIFAGLRIAAALAVIGTLIGELVASFSVGGEMGLGMLIDAARKQGRMALAYGGILMACAVGLAMFGAINFIAWACLRRWHASAQ